MNLKLDSDKLYHIFYSGFSGPPAWLILDEIAFCLKNNILLLKKERLNFRKEEFQKLIEKIKVIDGPGGSQGKRHMVLKNLAKKLMKENQLTSKQESYFMGLHPDVISDDFSWIIECGTTDPSVILLYFQNKKIEKVSILPYLFAEENKFVLYSFLRAKNFEKFQKIKKENLKNVFLAAKEKSIRVEND